MATLKFIIALFLGVLQQTFGLSGKFVCDEQQNYNLTTRVKYQQPVLVKTYIWCLAVPPKCSSTKTEIREKWRVHTEQKILTIQSCCPGFREQDNYCIPKCPEGLTGDKCNEDCPIDRWGKSCSRECMCPPNSNCDSINGKCICTNGWSGPSCNIPKNAFTRVPTFYSTVIQNRETKPLFDWNTEIRTTTKMPTTGMRQVTTKASTSTTAASVGTPKSKEVNKNEDDDDDDDIDAEEIDGDGEDDNDYDDSDERDKVEKQSTEILGNKSTVNVSSTAESITPRVDVSTTKLEIDNITTTLTTNLPETTVSTTKIVTIRLTTSKVTEESKTTTVKPMLTIPNTTPYSQIESPEATDVSKMTDSPITVISHNLPKTPVKIGKTTMKHTDATASSLDAAKATTSTSKRKQSSTEQTNPGIIDFTNNYTKKTHTALGTISTVNITKVQPTKHRYSKVHEGKLVTIPVRVIMDTPKNIYYKKYNNQSKVSKNVKDVTVSPWFNSTMITIDIQTEETKHVLTEPEQITSVAGSEDSGDTKDDLYSTLSIAAGIAAALILMATIIVMIARYKGTNEKRMMTIEMEQVQSMMGDTEDDVPSYLRSHFHSPLPDPPSKSFYSNLSDATTRPTTPFMQQVFIHNVSPEMMESFRDILECHYDHPKPPRPTSFTPPPKNVTFGPVTSSGFTRNTLPNLRESSFSPRVGQTGHSFPVTDAAISTLKLESKNLYALEMENNDPVYDEIPTWQPPRIHVGQVHRVGEESVTEL